MKNPVVTIFFLFIIFSLFQSCKKTTQEPGGYYNSIIVYKDGQIINEKYVPDHDSLTPRDIRSVTKSVLATLIGIAIDKGYIQSENQNIGDYIRPLYSSIDDAKANIKIIDLLTMSSGIEGSDLTSISEYENWRQEKNQMVYTLEKPLIHQPGEMFAYNSGASHLLSIILTKATGISTFQFAKENLFQPLNISDHYWEKDKQDYYNGSAGLCLTPNDMLKLGLLYLNKGIYNGIRIVSEEWINKTISVQITTNNIEPFGPGYGFLWWNGAAHGHDYYFANGYGGQFIVVTPDLQLVIVATNKWANISSGEANQRWYNTLDSIINIIIPSYN